MTDSKSTLASVCHWSLDLSFRDESQVQTFITELVKEPVSFELKRDHDDRSEVFYIYIDGIWADNLLRIAELAKEVDYQ